MTDVLEPPVPERSRAAANPAEPSKGVALTNWLVSRATGLLEKRSSRRGFLVGSAMVGSAVAVTGCNVATQPGAPYTHITDCGPSFCTDGYTEFCCAVNNGLNSCPPGSFAGGWWRADYSSFCNGTRYYIDCMQDCCGPATGYGNFCSGCTECRCANGCGTRRVYCNYFRYGQCHQEIVASGPIACRVVTCVPPYEVGEWACSTASAVDNSTAEHAGNCLPSAPPPPNAALLGSSGAAVQDAGGDLRAFVRGIDSAVWERVRSGGVWSAGWESLGGSITSGIAAASFGATTYIVARGNGRLMYGNKRTGGSWSGWHEIGGESASDPVALTDDDGIVVLIRGTDNAVWANRFDGTNWLGWRSGGGVIDSEPAAAWDHGGTIHVIARAPSIAVHANRFVGNSFGGWSYINEIAGSNPATAGNLAMIRAVDGSIHATQFSGGSWGGWGSLGGRATSDPVAVADATGVHVIIRGIDNAVWRSRWNGAWNGWNQMGGSITADPVAITGPGGTFVFARGVDEHLWYGELNGDAWSGWNNLGGTVAPVRATP